ncbi:MAG: hypothetical protein ACI9R3_001459 [Verrucomicrobiales bacterium]|jgi:hypothetical protein
MQKSLSALYFQSFSVNHNSHSGHSTWADFLGDYESNYRKIHGQLSPFSVEAVEDFFRCCDLSAGFTRLQCPNPECGHERLLAFICKSRHVCPACHQRRVCGTADWIAESLCKPVPHRQFVFTIPRMLRGIFRKRRHRRRPDLRRLP